MHAFRLLAVTLMSVGTGAVLLADRAEERRESNRHPRVTLFEHADFRGGSITLEPGQGVENLSRWNFSNGQNANDRISSILIEGGIEVIVYPDARFRGEPLRLNRDVRDLSA